MKEAFWLRGFLCDLGIERDHVDLWYDSQSVTHLAKNQVHHARTKHIDVRYHYVRDVIEDDDVSQLKVNKNENPADTLTKVVTGSKFHPMMRTTVA